MKLRNSLFVPSVASLLLLLMLLVKSTVILGCDLIFCNRLSKKYDCYSPPKEITDPECKNGFGVWVRSIDWENISAGQRKRLAEAHNKRGEHYNCSYGLRPNITYDVQLEKLSFGWAKQCWGNDRAVCRVETQDSSVIQLAFFKVDTEVDSSKDESPLEIEKALDFWTKPGDELSSLRFDCNHAPQRFGCGMIGLRDRSFGGLLKMRSETQHIVCAYTST